MTNKHELKNVPDFTPLAKSIVIGDVYDHFKGIRVKILGIAHHSETLEELVVYEKLNPPGGIWVRPITMFLESVTINGKNIPRFKRTEPGLARL